MKRRSAFRNGISLEFPENGVLDEIAILTINECLGKQEYVFVDVKWSRDRNPPEELQALAESNPRLIFIDDEGNGKRLTEACHWIAGVDALVRFLQSGELPKFYSGRKDRNPSPYPANKYQKFG